MNYYIRQILPNEAEKAESVELACFPPNEACVLPIMKQRVEQARDLFLVAMDEQENMIGIIDAIATNERHLKDAFFTDISLHDPNGKHCMILGLAIIPSWQGKGVARALMESFIKAQRNRESIVLTCLESKVELYKKLGYLDLGVSDSSWGGEEWHEMVYTIRQA